MPVHPRRSFGARAFWRALLCCVLIVNAVLVPAMSVRAAPPPAVPPAPDAGSAAHIEAAAPGPVAFVPNQGQLATPAQFSAQAGDLTVHFASAQVQFQVPSYSPAEPALQRQQRSQPQARRATPPAADPATVTMHLINAQPTSPISAGQRLAGVVNDYRSSDATRWRSGLPTYDAITYQSVYPGIDLRYGDAAGQLKSTYLVGAQVDPAQIRWRYEGAASARIDGQGNLVLELPGLPGRSARAITESAPIAWQESAEQRVLVPVSYVRHGDGSFGFATGAYDPALPLIIDPTISTADIAHRVALPMGITVDSEGDLYIVGEEAAGGVAVKLASDGETLLYRTLFSGFASDVAVATDMHAYIGAHTYSTGSGELASARLIELDDSGALVADTALGTGFSAGVQAVAYDPTSDMLAVLWYAQDVGSNLSTGAPGSLSATALGDGQYYDVAVGPNGVAYVTHIDTETHAGQVLKFGQGGGGAIALPGDVTEAYVAVDIASNVYVAATSHSDTWVNDVTIRKFAPSGAVAYTVPLAGSAMDVAQGIAVNPMTNRAYVTGYTSSLDFPTLDSPAPAGDDGFVASIEPGGALRYSLAMAGLPSTQGIAVSYDGAVGVVAHSPSGGKLVQIDAAPYSVGLSMTPLPLDANNQRMLELNSDTGWYETPVLTFTVAITNNREIAQNVSLELDISGPRHQLYSNDFLVEDEQTGENPNILLPAGATVTQAFTMWVKPSAQSIITGTVDLSGHHPTMHNAQVAIPQITVPQAAIRPVVIVAGFVASMPSTDHPSGYELDPMFGTYDGLVSQLVHMGYEKELSLIEFAYPWYGRSMTDKNNLADLGADLKARIDGWWQTRTAPPYVRTDEVDIIAHSTGGLITRYYGSKLGGTAKMHSVFFVASPHMGAPTVYASLEGLDSQMYSDLENAGAKLIFKALAKKQGCYSLNQPSLVKTVSDEDLYRYLHGDYCITTIYDSAGNLLSRTVGDPQPGIPLMRELLPPIGAPSYLKDVAGADIPNLPNPVVEDLHAQRFNFVNEVAQDGGHIFAAFSSNDSTLVSYTTVAHPPYAPLWRGGMFVPRGWTPSMTVAQRPQVYTYTDVGDGVLPAASMDFKGLVGGSPDVVTIELNDSFHEGYFNDPKTLVKIVARLVRADADQAFIDSMPPMDIPEREYDYEDIENAIAFLNECPVAMLITDEQGRRIGTTPQGEDVNEIPGGFYTGHDEENGPDLLWFPRQSGTYSLTITGLEPGSFEIRGQVYSDTTSTPIGYWTGELAPGLTQTATFTVAAEAEAEAPRTLIVDDHAGPQAVAAYSSTLHIMGQAATVWPVAQRGVPTLSDLYPYSTVVWSTGNSTAFTTAGAAAIQQYMANGGNVLLAGEDVDQQVGATPIFTGTVRAEVLRPTSASRALAGDDLLAGLALQLGNDPGTVAQDSPTLLLPLAGAVPLARMTDGADAGQVAGLRYADRDGKLVYLGFGVEGLQNLSQRLQVMQRIVHWFTDTPLPGPATASFEQSASTVHENVGSAPLSVKLSHFMPVPVVVYYAIAAGTTTNGSDHSFGTGKLTFQPGETRKDIRPNIVDDGLLEHDESFTVSLDHATEGVLIESPALHTVTIAANDSISFSASAATISEGASGTITVRLSAPSAQSVTVTYLTRDGSAAAVKDYVKVGNTLTFAPGETVKTFSVTTKTDTVSDPNETFWVDLSAPANAQLGTPASIKITIVEPGCAGLVCSTAK